MSILKLYSSGPAVIKRWWASAQLDRGYEQLLKREGTFVHTKEGTRVLSLKTGGLVCTRWTKTLKLGQMWHVEWAAAQHLLSPFPSPLFGVELPIPFSPLPIRIRNASKDKNKETKMTGSPLRWVAGFPPCRQWRHARSLSRPGSGSSPTGSGRPCRSRRVSCMFYVHCALRTFQNIIEGFFEGAKTFLNPTCGVKNNPHN